MIRPQLILDVHDELIVDNFAGGGGASTGIEMSLGRHVDIAVNHDPMSIALHTANHSQTQHFCEDVFKIDPVKVTNGRRVGLAWFSPDCKHFSKAKGGKPRSKKIRGLAWVVVKWAAKVKPRVVILENVEEFQTWGPLLPDGSPCPARKGRTFKNWVARLQNLGYVVDWRELRACDYGAPTIRKRLYLIARCDGKPIVWPNATHGDPSAKGFRGTGLKRWRTAAECIDWSLPCPSIFLTKEQGREIGVKRPLADATMKRVARGVMKFVIEAKEPFIVSLTHQGGDRNESLAQPFRTLTGAHRGEKALVTPFVARTAHGEQDKKGKRRGKGEHPANEPLPTQCASKEFALVTPFIAGVGGRMGQSAERGASKPLQTLTAKADSVLVTPIIAGAGGPSYGGKPRSGDNPFQTLTTENHSALVAPVLTEHANATNPRSFPSDEPMRTQCAEVKGGHFALVGAFLASHLSKLYGTTTGQDNNEPLHTVTSGGNHIAEVRAFLIKYYGSEKDGQECAGPIHTIPTVDRFGLFTIEGQPYCISDIGLRMLVPRELYRGQGFPESYIINIEVEVIRHGKRKRVPLSQEAQVRMCGNSVCPDVAEALVTANVPEMAVWRNGEKRRFQKNLKQLCHA
jgi:DNA (cytosine-5)-methyltransferase 1